MGFPVFCPRAAGEAQERGKIDSETCNQIESRSISRSPMLRAQPKSGDLLTRLVEFFDWCP